MLWAAALYGFDQNAEIGGVRKQTAFSGFERLGEAFTGEDFVVENAETAAVQGERAGVFDPDGAKRASRTGCAAPQRYFFGFDFGLGDGHECGLIFLEAYSVFEFVFEKIAQTSAV